MCGIAGIFNFNNNILKIPDNFILKNMLHRGPDSSNLWKTEDNKLTLYHTRLSIVDLSEKANQPMDYMGKYQIVFNGEIYNYIYLKKKLEQKGYIFKTNSDTEVILALYNEYSKESFDMLEGIFAFAIYDCIEKKLIIARDLFGVKPIYFFHNSKHFIFSSEVKLIKKIYKQLSKSSSGWIGYSLLGSVPEPFTIYKDVFALKPGNVKEIESDGSDKSYSFNSIQKIAQDSEVFNEDKQEIDSVISESIKNNLIGDVKKSVFLSSGFDSSLISLISKKHDNNLTNLSLGFNEYKLSSKDELDKAIKFSKTNKTEFIGRYYEYNDYSKYKNIFFKYMDQPTIDGFNVFLISLLAKQNLFKVALSGIGGDENFCSYPSFKNIPNIINLVPFKASTDFINLYYKKKIFTQNSFFKKITSILDFSGSIESLYFLQRSLCFPNELKQIYEEDFIIDGLQNLNLIERMKKTHNEVSNLQIKISLLELEWYMKNQLLKDADVFGMANSIEIRVPLLSKKILFNSFKKMKNRFFNKKQLVSKYYSDLPFDNKKLGFSFPIKEWIMKENKLKSLNNLEWTKYINNNFNNNDIQNI